MTKKNRLVISAVNLVEGGTLTVLRSCLRAAEDLPKDWQVVVLVHDRSLVRVSRTRLVEVKWSKRSWGHRLYFEWFWAGQISRKLNADVWLSLHDITSNVSALRQAVYCHNPSPFYKPSVTERLFDPTFAMFCAFYAYLYGLMIHRNRWVIVQQRWLAEAFRSRWALNNVIVAHPESDISSEPLCKESTTRACQVFSYPTFPRVYKNIEQIAAALEILERNPEWHGEVRVTISGEEGRYARHLKSTYRHLSTLRFIGRQSKEMMAALYKETDCLLFPSKLETWGLPITEFKRSGRPMIVADLAYAFETVGSYSNAAFVSPDDPSVLAKHMLDAHLGRFRPAPLSERANIAPPDVYSWDQLLSRLIS